MSEEKITALAREYAEEISPVNKLKDYPQAKMIVGIMQSALSEATAEQIKDFEGFLRFLLRRYALVEKEAIRKEYEMVKKIWEQVTLVDAKTFNEGRISEIESLFPEIGKEVEE